MTHNTITDKNKFLSEIFGYDNFRHGQDAIIDSLVENSEDNLVIIPTGGGKSLIYQIAGSVIKNRKGSGITLIVSPLISLMKDQVKELNERGMNGMELSSHNTDKGSDLNKILSSEADFVFVSPEKLAQKSFQKIIKNADINLFVIDEAHCCSMWGHQFRPEYGKVGEILKSFGKNVPILGLTATANEKTMNEIRKMVFYKGNPKVHVGGYYRSNFDINTITDGTDYELIKSIEGMVKEGKNGILYFQTVKELQVFEKGLFAKMIKDGTAGVYHGKGEKEDRMSAQKKFIDGDHRLLLATTAFGMGVNKPNVDFVIHKGYPSNVEAYYQEIGRAGRDGRQVKAIMYKQNLQTRLFFVDISYISTDNFKTVLSYLQSFAERFSESSEDFKIRDFKALSEKSLGKDSYANAIYSTLYKYGIISKSDDGTCFVNLAELKKYSTNVKLFSELDKIRDFKRKQAIEMDEFFSKTSKFSLKNIDKRAKNSGKNPVELLGISTYLNVLDFFGDEEGIKGLIDSVRDKPFDLKSLKYSEYYDLKTNLGSLGYKELLNQVSVIYMGTDKSSLKSSELFFDDVEETTIVETNTDIVSKVDRKKQLSDGLGLF